MKYKLFQKHYAYIIQHKNSVSLGKWQNVKKEFFPHKIYIIYSLRGKHAFLIKAIKS